MSARKRPLWASYIVAYFLLGFGGTLIDVASRPSGNDLLRQDGQILRFAVLKMCEILTHINRRFAHFHSIVGAAQPRARLRMARA